MLASPLETRERKPKENQHVRHFSSPRILQPDEPVLVYMGEKVAKESTTFPKPSVSILRMGSVSWTSDSIALLHRNSECVGASTELLQHEALPLAELGGSLMCEVRFKEKQQHSRTIDGCVPLTILKGANRLPVEEA